MSRLSKARYLLAAFFTVWGLYWLVLMAAWTPILYIIEQGWIAADTMRASIVITGLLSGAVATVIIFDP